MADGNLQRLRTRFIATRGVKEYRATIPAWVTPRDIVLEIGCEWGTTTAMIAPQCQEVIGTDVSRECIARARALHPGIRFEVLDGFDVLAGLALNRPFTKVYIDISGLSGYRSLLDTIALLNTYAALLRPEAIVVKSGALKSFAGNCLAWRSPDRAGGGGEH